MPLYEYACQDCGHRFEVRQGIREDPLTTCPNCGGKIRRVIHPVGIVFKGSGFYKTDSRAAAQSANGSSEQAPSTETAAPTGGTATTGSDTSGSTAPAAEAKPAAKAAESATAKKAEA
jgi:putative FmdB family regulatory protein